MSKPSLTRWVPALFGVVLCAAPAVSQQGAVDIPIESYRLDNGLRVILSPDRSTPVVAVNVWYDVGSRNEREGRSGFAHLFEHMMFQGSENVPRGDHMTLVERAGGNMNGTTSEDRTNYFETLPSNRLNLGLWLEADRMRSLAITQFNFENQREVVKEERRLRVDNSPYGTTSLAAMYEVPYNAQSCFSYAHNVIGSMADLDAAELEDVQAFFDTYYAPNNATLTVVGDFQVDEARRMIEEYFGEISSGPAPPPVTCENPFTDMPTRRVIEDTNANLPALFLSYGAPASDSRDTYALSLLGAVLGQGESSRLNQRLVKEEQAALQAQVMFMERRGPGLFVALAIANQGTTVERLEELMEEEIARIRDEGITEDELQKVKMLHRAQTVRSLQTVMGRAEQLQHFAHWKGDPSAVRNDLDNYAAVTAADIQRVAAQYLVPSNRATVITQPATAAPASGEDSE